MDSGDGDQLALVPTGAGLAAANPSQEDLLMLQRLEIHLQQTQVGALDGVFEHSMTPSSGPARAETCRPPGGG
jgi:hypothetical protein